MAETTEIAYAAGMFDGEGCVRLYMNNNGKYGLRVQVSQRSPEVLYWLEERFGGKFSKSPSQTCAQWYAHGQQAQDFLLAILPYLIVKKDQAVVAIEAYATKNMTAEVSAELSRLKRVS